MANRRQNQNDQQDQRNQRNRRNQQNQQNQQNQDWIDQVPDNQSWNGPYDDYGWETDESGLPEFRDPSEQRMPYDRPGSRRYQRWHGGPRGQQGQQGQQNWQGQQGQQGWQGQGWQGQQGQQQGPYYGVGPKGYQRSDQRILEDVCDRLTQHGEINASDMEVSVDNGIVTLRGTAEDRRAKRMAEDVADSVRGVQDVNNELRIESGQPGSGSGKGRRDRVGGSGVYPASAQNAPDDAQAQGMASWGQGPRGAAGYNDSGGSELDLGPENENQPAQTKRGRSSQTGRTSRSKKNQENENQQSNK